MNTTVTMSLEEFEKLRFKAKQFDELECKYDQSLPILRSRMANVLSKVVEILSGETNYDKIPKLNRCTVNVKPDVATIKNMEIKIGETNVNGYYDASIICNY